MGRVNTWWVPWVVRPVTGALGRLELEADLLGSRADLDLILCRIIEQEHFASGRFNLPIRVQPLRYQVVKPDVEGLRHSGAVVDFIMGGRFPRLFLI